MSSHRRRRVEASSDEEEERKPLAPKRARLARASRGTTEEEAQPTTSRKGKGRAVQQPDSDDEAEQVGEDDEDTNGHYDQDDEEQPAQLSLRQLERGDDGYVAGSIVRLRLINFMTYDYVDFQPGPHLNMILGPNGTGKSTIAAAIAIGLAFSPKVMGRASDLKSYVKQGKEIAKVEVEIKGRGNGRNPVIHRTFNRETGKSEWLLNGRSASEVAVKDLVRGFGVQANNLCSFLPQDKVADFAKMDPKTVLKETMRAAGDPRLSGWHEQLVEYGERSKTLHQELLRNSRQRDHLRAQMESIEPDVQHVQAKQTLERDFEVAKLVVLAATWEEKKKAVNERKQDAATLLTRITKRETGKQSILDLQKMHHNLLKDAEEKVKGSKSSMGDQVKVMEICRRRMADAEKEFGQYDAQLEGLKAKAKQRKENIKRWENRRSQAQAVLDSPLVNQGDIHTQLETKKDEKKACTARLRPLETTRDNLGAALKDIQREVTQLNTDLHRRDQRQQELSNMDHQRREMAFKLDPSIQYAVEWIEKNATSLSGKVHYPPMITVNVPDKRFAWQVEACTSLGMRKTFICEEQADYEKLLALNDKVINGHRVGLHLAQVTVNDDTVNPARPCSDEQLHQLGLQGWAIDYVEAEPGVRAFLCQSNMHRAAITQRPGRDIDMNRVASAGIPMCITSTDVNRCTRSLYGRRDYQISSSAPTQARAFSVSVDTEKLKEITEEMAELKRRLRSMEEPLLKAKADHEESMRAVGAAKDEVIKIETQMKELKTEMEKFTRAELDLKRCDEELARLRKEPALDEQREKLEAQLLKSVRGRTARLMEHQDAAVVLGRLGAGLALARLKQRQREVNLDAIMQAIMDYDDKTAILREERGQVLDEHNRLKQEQAQALGHMKRAFSEKAELKELVTQQRNEEGSFPTLPEAREREAELKVQLELAMNTDPTVVDRYNRLKKELQEYTTIVEGHEKEHAEAEKKVQTILAKFEPALDALVAETSAKFSRAFQRIGCSGEVTIRKLPGEYAQWGIAILVSYRDNQAMEVLTLNRQSGGERSLATVTYLMSLAEVSRTPFSLVDEINQGMDSRAERSVHNSLVKVTCGSGVGQYFLITPKLLTGLDYDPKMRILAVHNGTWVPSAEDPTQRFGGLAGCLDKYKKHHGIAA